MKESIIKNTQWYQLRFRIKTSVSDKHGVYFTGNLLNTYINNLLTANKSLDIPFIVNIFALNHRNGNFDTSLPPLLFIECASDDMKLLINMVNKADIAYMTIEPITHDKVDEFRLLHANVDEEVWSGVYMLIQRISDNNLLTNIQNIEKRIRDFADKYNIEILKVHCQNLYILKQKPSDRSPILVYIKHKSKDNDKLSQLLRYYRNLVSCPVSHYSSYIGNIDENTAEKAGIDNISQNNVVVFNRGDRVIVMDRNHISLNCKGTVISQVDDKVYVSINIFNQPIECEFDVDQIMLESKVV